MANMMNNRKAWSLEIGVFCKHSKIRRFSVTNKTYFESRYTRMGESMNIIICDDSQRDRENLIELLKSYAKEKEQKNA